MLRIPSLFEPYWYGDEGIYQTVGLALQNGRLLYTEIWDNKPPLLYLIYALVLGDQFLVRLFSLITGLFSVVIFFYICKKLFIREKSSIVATFIFVCLFGLPIFEGNIANAENFMILPTLSGILFYLSALTSKKSYLFPLSGFLLCISFLFKFVAIFDLFALILFLVFFKRVKMIIPLLIGFSFPLFFMLACFSIMGILEPFLQTVFIDNAEYISYNNTFIFQQGFIMIKVLLLLFSLYILKRHTPGKSKLFISIFLIFSLFNIYFSGRIYHHYVLLLLPAFSLLVGIIFEDKRRNNYIFFAILSIILLICSTFGIFGNTIWYYQNFILYITKHINEDEYKNFFDPITVRNYRTAEYIRNNTVEKDTIFIWGNSAQIYKLSNKLPPGRFTVAYHMARNSSTLKESEESLNKSYPELIIILPDYQEYPYQLSEYVLHTSIDDADIYIKKD